MNMMAQIKDGFMSAFKRVGLPGHDIRSRAGFFGLTDAEIEATYRSGWVMRKIIDKPATEMVREGRDWQAEAGDIKKLEALEESLDLWNKIKRAEILRGLGGAGMILWTDEADQERPLSPDSIRKGALKAIHVWHRSRFTLGPLIEIWGDPWFGFPSYYEIRLSGQAGGQSIKFHPSRVVAFRGEAVPDIASATTDHIFWGDSKVQVVLSAVCNVDASQDGFAALIKDARNRRLYVPGLTEMLATEGGERMFAARVSAMAMGESTVSVTYLDAGDADGKGGEKLEDRQMVWQGIPDIAAMYLAAAAGAADMPATVLLGKSPDGMNATGSSDLKIWEKTIKARQDLELRPCLRQIDAVLIPSAGVTALDIWWKFAPLSTPTEAEEAITFDKTMDGVTKLQNTGAIPDEAFAKGLQNLMTERGWIPGLEGALAEIPENERFGIEADLDEEGGDPDLAGGGDAPIVPARRAANDARFLDATPRTLYVCRKVQNLAEIKAWAKSQGLPALQDDLHVTLIYSRRAIDWMKVEAEDWNQKDDGTIEIPPGGVRIVEPLGYRTAVLLFTSSRLSWRHEQIVRAGAEHGFPDYQPHMSLTGEPVDLAGVEPYRGRIILGPEIFEEIRSEGA